MSMVTQGYISDLYFGFDTERLLLRLDSRGGPFREQLADVQALRVVFLQPEGFELLVAHPSRKEPEVQLWRHGAVDGRVARRGRGRPALRVGHPLPQPRAARPTSRSISTSNCSRTSSRSSASRTKARSKPSCRRPITN